MDADNRIIAVVGRLGVYPLVPLSLPARRILAYLALRGKPVTRSATAEILWPDLPEETGRANLRRALWHVPRGWIVNVGDELILDAQCDLPGAQLAAARAIEGEPLSFADIALLSNDILPGWHDEWVLGAHEAFRLLRVQALETACRTMTRDRNFALATHAGTAAVTAEPLRESAAEALIEAHLAQRNRYEAMLCYRALTQRLHDELGVPANPELAAKMAFAAPVARAAN